MRGNLSSEQYKDYNLSTKLNTNPQCLSEGLDTPTLHQHILYVPLSLEFFVFC